MITGTVRGQKLSVIEDYIVSDSVNYITCKFSFSDDWNVDGLDRYVFFEKFGEEPNKAIIEDDGSVLAERGLNITEGVWNMYIVGEIIANDGETVEKRITTNEIPMRVHRTGSSAGNPFPEVTPTIGEQIIAQASGYASAAAASATEAEGYAERAEAAAESVHDVEEQVVRAETAATTATEKASAASSSASSAESSATSAAVYASAASAAATAAQEATVHGPRIGTSGTWELWDQQTSTYVDTGVEAMGEDGEDGHSPYIGVNGHWFVWVATDYVDSGVNATGPAGETGDPGVYVGDMEPADPDVMIWVKETGDEVTIPTPVAKTAAMTQAVGMDAETGRLYTTPGGGGGGGAVSSVNGQTGDVVLDAEDVGALPDNTAIPDALSDLADDATHRTVTDTEKSAWNAKQSKITANGILKGDGDGGISAAVPGTDYLTLEEADNKYAEKTTGATAGSIAVFDEDGNLVDSGYAPDDFVQYGAVTVSISATDDAVPAQGDGISVQLYLDTELIDTVVYNNQPVTFSGLIPNASYKVQPVGTWSGHYRPTPAFYSFEALSGATTSVAIVYASMTVPETLQDLADIVQNGGTQNLTIGTQFTIPWRDVAANVDYNAPVDIVDVREIEDQNGVTHEAAIIQWHYTTPFAIQYDAAEGVAATETTAEAGMYYYGITGATYTLLTLSAGDPIPYGDYDSVVKDSVKDPTYNIIKYGYNRYRDSAVRQFLNSESGVGEWWAATHVGDNAPQQLNSRAGFLSGFSTENLALMKPCKITCKTNIRTDEGVIDTLYDRWWLASGTEMYGSVNDNEGTYLPYWKSATGLSNPSNNANVGRIVYGLDNHSSAQWMLLRSVNPNGSHYTWVMNGSGEIRYANISSSTALPVCAIY